MIQLVMEPTSTAHWQQLLQTAQQQLEIELGEASEHYLILLLKNYAYDPELASSVLALDYLENLQKNGLTRCHGLRQVGDRCLLFAGLFPGMARRKHVPISYYVSLGQSAYASIAEANYHGLAKLYHQLSCGFVNLMDVLLQLRTTEHSHSFALTPDETFHLWQDTQSKYSFLTLQSLYPNCSLLNHRFNTHKKP